MGSDASRRVWVIVDTEFRRSAESLPPLEPAWIVASPTNDSIVRRLRQSRASDDSLHGITLFHSDGNGPEATLPGVLDNVELHHGVCSSSLVYSELEIRGCHASAEARAELSLHGFEIVATTREGFPARRLRQGK